MKKAWEKPFLEVLDVSMTMKFHPGHKPGDGCKDDGVVGGEEEDLFGS